jgi:hypothetical protein
MRQFPALYGILQRSGKSRLPHDGVEGERTVFPGRNDIFHNANFDFVVQR